ncbi:MAG: ATP-binding protein [Candidatus Undinarchaeales archaeon]
MKDSELLTEFEEQNPWWQKKFELEPNLIEREIQTEISKKEKLITGIIGMRRVGKTTLLKQILSNLLKETEPKRILYFSFDAVPEEPFFIKNMLRLYAREVLNEPLSGLKSKIYVFLDEVQKIKKWGEEVKSIYDKDFKIKFFVSGSSSMNILKGSGESLVGRIKFHRLNPFSFREFLRFQGIEVNKINLDEIRQPKNAEKLKIEFSKYWEKGGLPELYTCSDPKTVLKQSLDLTFYRDVVEIFKIKRTDLIRDLFYAFLKESGNTINYSSLADSLKTKYETIREYVSHLESSFLISKSRLYSKSRLKRSRKNPKIYVSDHGFFMLNGTKEGMVAETMAFNHAKKLGGYEMFYWKDRRKEVDIILKGSNPTPIEVKYKGTVSKKDIKGILKFMELNELKKGIVVTKDEYKKEKVEGKLIIFIPLWMFMLCE